MKLAIFGLLALVLTTGMAQADVQKHPFSPRDLVMMDRVGSPALSPDAEFAAFTVRKTDFDDNKGVTSVWVVPLDQADAKPKRLAQGHSPSWGGDGQTIYYLSAKSGTTQLWRIAPGGKPQQVSDLPLSINHYTFSPDGHRLLLSIDIFTDCDDLACTRSRLDQREESPQTGRLYDRLFVRHWDHWLDGRQSQLFIAPLDSGKLGNVTRLTRHIDANVPSKPFGGSAEYAFSPDGNTVYFTAKIVGKTAAWSTNFDIYSVPTDGSAPAHNLTSENKAWDAYPTLSHDGKTLYYLAMSVPGFERDQFRIMALDLENGKRREIAPDWDRSPGSLTLSKDGQTLYATAHDYANVTLFAIDIDSGKATRLVSDGTVTGFSVADGHILSAFQDFTHPSDLFLTRTDSNATHQVTHFNQQRLAKINFGDYRFFSFKGWNGDTVQGYVMRPANFESGKRYPVAFLVHGGPQGAWLNEFHYRWNPEVYAGQGYAVVAINFHGSVGYGQAFTDAISGHWGDRPLTDLKNGWAAALKKFSFLDRQRACALGASYGGYMIYWMAGVWNEPWQCFVDHDGVFNTRMMYYATEELWFEEHEFGGPEYKNPKGYEKFNPLNHVDQWRVPTLVVHSARDYRIPISQGIGAFNALQRQDIPSKFLTFPDESHLVLKPANSLQWHHVVLDWLDQWVGQDNQKD